MFTSAGEVARGGSGGNRVQDLELFPEQQGLGDPSLREGCWERGLLGVIVEHRIHPKPLWICQYQPQDFKQATPSLRNSILSSVKCTFEGCCEA